MIRKSPSSSRTNKPLAGASLVAAISLALAACQSAAQPQVQPQVVKETVVVEGTPQVVVVTATPEEASEAAPTQAAPMQPSDTLVMAFQQEPDTLHPIIGSMQAKTIALSPVLVGCIAQNEKAEWVGLGCESVPTLDNGGATFVGDGEDRHIEMTYKIREGWRWNDGVPVTGNDAVYAWKLMMDPEFEIAARTAPQRVYDVEAPDDRTFIVKLMSEKQAKEAAAGALTGNVPFDVYKEDYIAQGFDKQVGPVTDPTYWNLQNTWLPAHILESIPAADHAASDYARAPLGDGPYQIKEWKQGQELVLEASPQPFPLGEPKIKTIVMRFFAETAAVLAALQKGEVDLVTQVGGLTVNNVPDLDNIEATGMYVPLYQQGYAWEHIDLNTTKFPFDDVRVRQALYYALDRQSIVDRLYFGRQKVTDLPVPPGLSVFYTDNYTRYPYDPDKAKALLSEAGWDCSVMPCTKEVDENGQKTTKNLEFTLMTTDRADRQAVAQVVQQQWKALNIGVNLQFLYGRGLFAACSAGGPLYCRSFDAAIFTWNTGDDATFLGLYDCAAIPTEANGWAGQNYTGYCNSTADEALTKSEVDPEISLSPAKRKPIVETFFQEWTKDVPVIPIYSETKVFVTRPGMKNFRPGTTQFSPETWNVWEWELEK